jgi:hypothetical protein
VPVLPPDAHARGIFLEHLLDHSCPARLRNFFGLNDDPVSGVRPHLCLILLFRFARALGEASAPFPPVRSSAEGGPPGRRFAGIGDLEADVARPPSLSPIEGRRGSVLGIGKGGVSLPGELDGMPVGVGALLGA